MFALLATTLIAMPADWDKGDTIMLSALAVVSAYDLMETRYHLKNGQWAEADPLLGSHPSDLRLWVSYAVAQSAMFTACYFAPKPLRKALEMLVLGVETLNVVRMTTLEYYGVVKLSF